MAKLTEAMKGFIVQNLACYDTPSQVSEAVKEQFGVEVPRNQVEQYDPNKVAGKTLANKWKVLFEDTRERFRTEVAEIPIANQAYRLRQLQNIAQDAMRRKNSLLVANVMEQAAKEVGGMFTNKREIAPTGNLVTELVITRAKASED